MSERLASLRALLTDDAGLDAILVSQPENRRYLSGFTGSAGWLLVSHEAALLATDSRYTEQATGQASAFRVVPAAGDMAKWLSSLLREAGSIRRVGFEAEHVAFGTYRRLASIVGEAGLELVPVERMVEPLRAVKDTTEREAILRAVRVTDAAFQTVAGTLEPGMTERQVAWRIEQEMRQRGAEAVAFDLIVAAGPNGAMAHHHPTDRPLREGEPIVIDIGARVDGYCADLTRTVVLGTPDDTFRRVYDIVLSAQLIAIATLEAGLTGEQADALARNVIEQAGYGEMFGHSLGHGVGLAVHEAPRLGRDVREVLQEGMIFTVEPGIYLSGWGGVRIEDVVELRNGRCTVLSGAPKDEQVRMRA